KAGYDVTVVSQFRREAAGFINNNGITVRFNEIEFNTKVRAVYVDDLKISEEGFDLLLLTGKSNDTVQTLEKMLPFLKNDGIVVSLQNGINEDAIIPLAGAERVIPCVCFAGGILRAPGYVETHDGRFIIGELDGRDTERLHELGEILGHVKSVEITPEIMKARWGKLAEVSLTVAVAAVSGLGLFAGFGNGLVRKVFALLACENFNVASACGISLGPVLGLNEEEWKRLAAGEDDLLAERLVQSSPMAKFQQAPPVPPEPHAPQVPPEPHAPPAPTDAYTSDIKKGLPLEIDYTNGYIIGKGKKYGVEVAAHELVTGMIHELEKRERTAGLENLKMIVERLG
ncbi:MAG: ketopantoate reductase family protein, partial [Clostridiales bacterium]|nr:ketopantoate reductase family protein [Clostridiales bacterium]